MILPRFYPVLPDAAMIARLVPMGVRLVQLRFKGDAGDVSAQIAAALATCARHGAQLVVNDHWQAALDQGADFIHLGQEDLDTADTAAIARAGARLGVSVLLIAGLDSSTGAGLARDLAVMADHGMTARVAATAMTAQDAAGGCTVHHPVPAAMVAVQIRAAGPLRAAKLGMLANASIVGAIAATLPDLPFVLDPVPATSAGAMLLDAAGCAAMIARLIPRATLVTPNLPEAARLTGPQSDAALGALAQVSLPWARGRSS